LPPKRFEYAVSLGADGRLLAEGADPIDPGAAWTPEHFVLAGLMRCTLKSLAFHAERASVRMSGSASAEGVVARREDDGRYAFVELDVELDLELEPVPPGEEMAALLTKTDRDCFVGASLKPAPSYRWRVNGRDL